jgi:ribosomal protein L11 methyltransferase
MSASASWRVRFCAESAQAEALADALFDVGATGIDMTPQGNAVEVTLYAEKKRDGQRFQREVLRRAPGLGVELTRISKDEWLAPWRESLGAERVSPGFCVQPIWHDAAPEATVRAIRVEPDLVFGVGGHPSTRLAAAAVEAWCKRYSDRSVLDVGTGTGVLAIIAAHSGASRVLGIDVDRRSVRAARKHAKLNDAAGRARFSERALGTLHERYDLVVANMEGHILTALAPDLARVTAHTLVLAGLLLEQAEDLENALAPHALHCVERESEEDWARLTLQRAEIAVLSR